MSGFSDIMECVNTGLDYSQCRCPDCCQHSKVRGNECTNCRKPINVNRTCLTLGVDLEPIDFRNPTDADRYCVDGNADLRMTAEIAKADPRNDIFEPYVDLVRVQTLDGVDVLSLLTDECVLSLKEHYEICWEHGYVG